MWENSKTSSLMSSCSKMLKWDRTGNGPDDPKWIEVGMNQVG